MAININGVDTFAVLNFSDVEDAKRLVLEIESLAIYGLSVGALVQEVRELSKQIDGPIEGLPTHEEISKRLRKALGHVEIQ